MRKFSVKKNAHRINEQIRVPQVRVISDDGSQLGVMSSRDACMMAKDKGLDLVEVAPNSSPPTCKILDYGKWKYEQKKKEKASRKNQSAVVLKEIQLRLRTEDHDFMVKVKRARDFLDKQNKVKVSLRFQGREMAYPERGFQLMERVKGALQDLAQVESPPKKEGRQMIMVFAPLPESKRNKPAEPSSKEQNSVKPVK